MGKLNKIINEQRERIAELESENSNLAVRCNKFNDQLNEALLDADKERLRAEAAENRIAEVELERDKLRCAVATAIDVFDDYDMDVETYAPIKHVKMKQGLRDSLNEFAIEQKIKALEEALHTVANQYNGTDSTEWANGANHVLRLFVKHTSRLRQQLNGGE